MLLPFFLLLLPLATGEFSKLGALVNFNVRVGAAAAAGELLLLPLNSLCRMLGLAALIGLR